jgi:hypothetical protein
VKKKADVGDLILRSQDEARCSMIPTRRTTLGLKGHRPLVGHLDGHALVSIFGALTLVTGHLTTRLVERGRAHTPGKKTISGQRRWQEGFARRWRDVARASPAAQYPTVGLGIENTPGHKGAGSTEVLAQVPPLKLSRWPSYRPQLQVSERFWRVWRRCAPHHRLLTALGALKQALRNSLCDDQTLSHRVLSGIQAPKKRTQLSVA